jgi:hypothetical protein
MAEFVERIKKLIAEKRGRSGQSIIVTRLERPSNVITQFRRISLPIKQA